MIKIDIFFCFVLKLSLNIEKGISKGKGDFWKYLKGQQKRKYNQIKENKQTNKKSCLRQDWLLLGD